MRHPPPPSPRVPHTYVIESGQHWFRYWLVAYSPPSRYLNQCWIIVNWAHRNKLQWNFHPNTKLFIHENASEYVVYEMAAIFSRGNKCAIIGQWLLASLPQREEMLIMRYQRRNYRDVLIKTGKYKRKCVQSISYLIGPECYKHNLFSCKSYINLLSFPWDSNKSLGKILNNDGHFKRIRCPFYFVIPQQHGPLTRYVKLWVGHAPGMPMTFSRPPRVSDPDMHHSTCVCDARAVMHTGIAK